MCGISAYYGNGNASEVLFNSLKRLDYRGYDSCGIVTWQDGSVHLKKGSGKIEEVHDLHDLKSLPGSVGIGHTRWATHGKVNENNAHPILSNSGMFALVQNGIVENYQEIREMLRSEGYTFQTETDTEVIVNLIEDHYKNIDGEGKETFREAVRLAFKDLKGRNAIAVLHRDTGTMAGARSGSPLIVGKGENEYFLASDIPAFLEHTNNVYYLDDGHMVVFNSGDGGAAADFYEIENGNKIGRRLVEINLSAKEAKKGDHPHFLIKEIRDQKETIRRAINQDEDQLREVAELLRNYKNCFLMGAGTAFRVCLMGEYMLSEIANYQARSVAAHEFKNYLNFVDEGTVIIVVSQSGETADDLEPMEEAQKKGAKIISIVNVEGSTIDRKSDYSFHLKSGVEKAVASTKATTAQAAMLALLSYSLDNRLKEGKQYLADLSSSVNDLLNPRYEEHVKNLADNLRETENLCIIGRGVNYPAALESEIKITETSYMHAHGFAGGELKHYGLSLIEDGFPVIVLSAQDKYKDEIHSNAKEIKSRGGYIIGVGPEEESLYDYWLRVPSVRPELSAIINIVPIQVLGYHLSILRGCNPDKPRNLAKCVSVK